MCRESKESMTQWQPTDRESECGGIRVCRESKEPMTQWQPTGNQNVEGSGCVGKARSQ